jgi:mono/diheme cytochrome c family protein
LALTLIACRGQVSSEPPVHLQRNMQTQRRYNPMEPNDDFRDGRAMRPIPQGAVSRETLKDDDTFFRGGEPLTLHYGADAPKTYDTPTAKPAGVTYAARGPLEVTPELLHQGERRYGSYCTPCHGPLGDGKGMIAQHGFAGIASLHQERIIKMPDGEIFSTITNGLRNMPSYASQIDEADRWAIIAYVRALQISQNATMADVPEDKRGAFAQAPKAVPAQGESK